MATIAVEIKGHGDLPEDAIEQIRQKVQAFTAEIGAAGLALRVDFMPAPPAPPAVRRAPTVTGEPSLPPGAADPVDPAVSPAIVNEEAP